MTTFQVDEVKPLLTEPFDTASVRQVLTQRFDTLTVEADCGGEVYVQSRDEMGWDPRSANAFIETVHLAFDHHLPLTLSPDDFWLCIAQGFAIHFKENVGTPDDWWDLKERAGALAEFDLTWWTSELRPVLDRVAKSAEGRADVEFWRSFYKDCGASGGPYVTGWINVLFPYLDADGGWRRNPYLGKSTDRMGQLGGGPSTGAFPCGLSMADVVWRYFLEKYDMKFVSGFVGTAQDPQTLGVRPKIGWGVGEVKAHQETKESSPSKW